MHDQSRIHKRWRYLLACLMSPSIRPNEKCLFQHTHPACHLKATQLVVQETVVFGFHSRFCLARMTAQRKCSYDGHAFGAGPGSSFSAARALKLLHLWQIQPGESLLSSAALAMCRQATTHARHDQQPVPMHIKSLSNVVQACDDPSCQLCTAQKCCHWKIQWALDLQKDHGCQHSAHHLEIIIMLLCKKLCCQRLRAMMAIADHLQS